jgi:hypothetical protein
MHIQTNNAYLYDTYTPATLTEEARALEEGDMAMSVESAR